MANPTTNFGWVMPTATDLVTDLPADFAVFGQGVDTSMAYLLGGTTGQILSKTSATNMAFTWINNDQGDITGVTAGTGISGGGTSGTVTVTNSMATAIDAKGDLVVGTGADAFSRLAVGTNNYLLTADSAEATGLKWAAPASGGGMTLISTLTFNNTVTNYTVSSGLSGYKQLFISGTGLQTSSAAAYDTLILRFNGDSTSGNYDDSWVNVENSTASGNYSDATNIWLGMYCLARNDATAQYFGNVTAWIQSPDSTSAYKGVTFISGSVDDLTPKRRSSAGRGEWKSTSAITSINLRSYTGSNLKAGIVLIYGVN